MSTRLNSFMVLAPLYGRTAQFSKAYSAKTKCKALADISPAPVKSSRETGITAFRKVMRHPKTPKTSSIRGICFSERLLEKERKYGRAGLIIKASISMELSMGKECTSMMTKVGMKVTC